MARVQPTRQLPRYDLSVVPTLVEPMPTENHPILQSSSSSTTETIPTPKKKTSPWFNLLWIGLAILISILLIIVVIVPIAVLANPATNTTTTTASTICPTTAITTTVTSSPLPAQCTSYVSNNDGTRHATYNTTTFSDYEAFATTVTWVRFEEPAGTLLANCPILPEGCGAQFPGWYTGLYPSIAGDVTYGLVCYTSNTDLCFDSSSVLITNCNGYYVFYLRDPPILDMRYCTI